MRNAGLCGLLLAALSLSSPVQAEPEPVDAVHVFTEMLGLPRVARRARSPVY